MKRIAVFLSIVAMLGISMAGCAPAGSSSAEQTSGRIPAQTQQTSPQNVAHPEGEETSSDGTRVRITINGVETYARINQTATARAFLEMLPFEVSGYRSALDICCAVSEELPNLPEENEVWNIGEIGWFDGWFTILCDNEEQFANEERVIIGKFEDEYLETVIAMEGNMNITVELAEDTQDQQSSSTTPVVYMTEEISPDSLVKIYEALDASLSGRIAVKLSTGEPGSNYLRPELIGPLVQSLEDPTIVECNTAYGGSRASTAMHYQVTEDHGYTALADVDIMDAEGSMTLPMEGGSRLMENYVGASFDQYDCFVVLSHFKGHSMAGFGGAIKNISIGIASAEGKAHIHSGGTGGSMWGGEQDAFLEAMAEAGKSVVDALDGNILYINVMNRLSVDCDCDGSPAEPDMHDIGILASYDPVALDQACVDLVYAAEDGDSLIQRMESRNGVHTLEHAEAIGLGSRRYELVRIDA